jgi:hypothetical protein
MRSRVDLPQPDGPDDDHKFAIVYVSAQILNNSIALGALTP